jgi:hypothetical protein
MGGQISACIFQGDRQPPLAVLDAGDAVDSPQIGEANSLTLRFRLGEARRGSR